MDIELISQLCMPNEHTIGNNNIKNSNHVLAPFDYNNIAYVTSVSDSQYNNNINLSEYEIFNIN